LFGDVKIDNLTQSRQSTFCFRRNWNSPLEIFTGQAAILSTEIVLLEDLRIALYGNGKREKTKPLEIDLHIFLNNQQIPDIYLHLGDDFLNNYFKKSQRPLTLELINQGFCGGSEQAYRTATVP
jgi:hypothetical protein